LLLTIFFNPVELRFIEASENDVYIVLDVMRATTTLAVMFDQGAKQVLAAQTLEQAREAAQKLPDHLLCGECHTKIPPGFDYNNSPAQFAQLDLSGRNLILATSNGTRALFACPKQSTRLAGSFYNAQAVVSYALALAQERDCNISIVCAGEHGYFSLEDAACAGYLALELLHRQPECEVRDSVHGAIALYESYPAARLLEHAQSVRNLRASEQEHDLEFCLKKNASTCVPEVVGVGNVHPILMTNAVK
jgi:2-phosphosulfolactate phosphatase